MYFVLAAIGWLRYLRAYGRAGGQDTAELPAPSVLASPSLSCSSPSCCAHAHAATHDTHAARPDHKVSHLIFRRLLFSLFPAGVLIPCLYRNTLLLALESLHPALPFRRKAPSHLHIHHVADTTRSVYRRRRGRHVPSMCRGARPVRQRLSPVSLWLSGNEPMSQSCLSRRVTNDMPRHRSASSATTMCGTT